MTPTIYDWARRWGVSAHAMADLAACLGVTAVTVSDGRSEAAVQAAVRLEGARKGLHLWRNNVGVLTDERGVPVRYGLANDSKAVNARLKSADLIGIRPVLITQAHVGATIGQFVSRECKQPGWRWSGSEREQGQAAWAALVLACGGDAGFCSGEGSL